MATLTTKTSYQAVQTTLSLLQDLLGAIPQRNFAVRLWDGTVWKPDPDAGEPPRFTLVLQHPGALRKMFLPPSELNLGEAFIYNDFDVEGDLQTAFLLADRIMGAEWGKMARVRYGKRLLSLPNSGQLHPGDAAAQLRGARH